MRSIDKLNPKIMFFYFAVVIVLSMFLMHPLFLIPSFIIAFLTNLLLNGKKIFRTFLIFLPVFLLIIIVNPLFNTNGNTVLFNIYKRPVTLESVLYGVILAILFLTVINWFSCYNAVITSEKFNYIFGKILPSTTLLLSMSFRLLPLYRLKTAELAQSREMVGKGVKSGNKPIKNGSIILSATVTNALDNSIITANAMRSRGFELKKKTSFAIYQYSLADFRFLFLTLILFAGVLWGIVCGATSIQIIPEISLDFKGVKVIFTAVCYGLLLLLPAIKIIWGDIKWNSIKLKI